MKRVIIFLLCLLSSIVMMGCTIKTESQANDNFATESVINENNNEVIENTELEDVDTFDYNVLVGLQKIKTSNVSKVHERDIKLTNLHNDEFIIIEAPADIINMFESNKEGLLCYDGNGRVTLSYALSSENKQFYDVVCANGVSFMNTHEGGVPFKTLFEDRKWYVAAHQFGDLLDIYSLHKDFTGDEFDFILSEFGKPDDYLVAGKHEVTIDTENTAFIYTMMIYEYENYNLVIRFAEQYANRDGVYEQTKMDVLESYLMSHYAMSDYLKDCKNSWGEACVFKSLDIY